MKKQMFINSIEHSDIVNKRNNVHKGKYGISILSGDNEEISVIDRHNFIETFITPEEFITYLPK